MNQLTESQLSEIQYQFLVDPPDYELLEIQLPEIQPPENQSLEIQLPDILPTEILPLEVLPPEVLPPEVLPPEVQPPENQTPENPEISFRCERCGKSYKLASSLKRHMNYFCGRKSPPITGYTKLGDDDFECQKCHRHYKCFSTIKRHIKHECDRPATLNCPFTDCEYRAKFRYSLLIHCRMVHRMDV